MDIFHSLVVSHFTLHCIVLSNIFNSSDDWMVWMERGTEGSITMTSVSLEHSSIIMWMEVSQYEMETLSQQL